MNRRNYLVVALLALPVLLPACVSTAPTRSALPVPAGHLYEGGYINVRSPNSDGWSMISSSPSGMEFAKGGVESNESFGAQLLMFPLPATNDKDQFVSLIKRSFEKDFDTGRYQAIESEFKYSEDRAYPCVAVAYVVKDTQAQTSPSHRETLLLQAKALYCRHPVRQETGFGIIYSHRGQSLYPKLVEEAQGFIDGAQVPAH